MNSADLRLIFRREVNLRNGCSSERHGERMNCADRERKREMMGKKGGRRERECFLLALLRGEIFPLHLFSVVQENATKAHLTIMTLMKNE